MPEKVTLKSIAREVGLSPATVSLVLNGKPVRVTEEHRRRILEVARREHYIPNQIARSLVTQQSKTLGLIVPNIESRFFSSLARNLELRCRQRGYALFITNSDDNSTNDSELVGLLVNRGVDGLFIISSGGRDAQSLAVNLSQLPVPFVMVDRTIDTLACDKVYFNNKLGGYLATRHLLDHGHTRIACMVNTKSATGMRRLAGYEQALGEKNIRLDPSLVLDTDYYIPDAYLAAQQLIRLNATAVFAGSDNIALGLLRYLYEHGLHVPQNYSVVGYDNSAADALFEPALTSIEQNVEELAAAALDLLFSRIAEENQGEERLRAHSAHRVVLKPRLIVKNSVRRVGGYI